MNLTASNFRKHIGAIRNADGTTGTREHYQYESGSTVYEVARIGGSLCYRVNFGGWLIMPTSPIHKAITEHFGLRNE